MDSLKVGEGRRQLSLRLATPDEVPTFLRAEVFITGEPPGEHRFLKTSRLRTLLFTLITGF